jgi:hypothetical protein
MGMKLPRWTIFGLAVTIAAVVIGACAWWWISWPERTAENFLHALRQGHVSEVHYIEQIVFES